MAVTHHPHIIERYRPSLDWWLALLVGGLLLILIAAIPYLMASSSDATSKLLAALGLIVIILYVIDLTFFSTYFLMPDGLLVVSQLRRHHFPYERMIGLRPGNVLGLVSVPGKKRFALSADCLVISIDDGPWKKITVSPTARDHFVESLTARAGRLRVRNAKKK